MSFKSRNSLTVTKMSWQWIADDGSSYGESSLRKFSSCSWQDEVWGIRRTACGLQNNLLAKVPPWEPA